MRFLDWILRRPKKPSARVEADDEGMHIRSDQEAWISVAWTEVATIQTFKLDLLTTDTICLEFLDENEAVLLQIQEDLPGFGDVANRLTILFAEIDAD